MPGQPPDNTTRFFGVPERLADLIVRYYDAELSEQGLAELREGLTQHAAARDLFVRWGLQIQTLSESLAPGYSEVDEPMPFAELNELAQMEANAQAQLVTLHDLGGSRFSLNLKRYAIAGAIAAVLVLAITLSFVFSGTGKAPDIADNTNTPSEPGPVGPALTNPVATLTATHNAQWDSQPAEDLRRGSNLHPNQRLTLTAGFAEITTARGAVAILEAPCVVELKDNDNALRLISGKLVGICETESSKGFVVHARDARIVDLGTEFGVEVSGQAVTATVFTGDIVLATPDHKPQPLTTNQTARVTDKGDSPSVVVEDRVALSFARRMPAPADTATITLGDPLIPAGLGVGDTFHLFFRTAHPDHNTTGGVDADWNIAQLNAYAQNRADNEPGSVVAGRFAWYAVASAVTLDASGNITGSTNAIDNTPIIAAVYLLDGKKIADNENDFYDGTLHLAHVGICSDGITMEGEVVRTGTGIGGVNMGQDSFGGNSPRIARGIPDQASDWLEASTDEQRGGARRGIYAVSQPITIVPGPGPRGTANE